VTNIEGAGKFTKSLYGDARTDEEEIIVNGRRQPANAPALENWMIVIANGAAMLAVTRSHFSARRVHHERFDSAVRLQLKVTMFD
jgi:hypothetical protein